MEKRSNADHSSAYTPNMETPSSHRKSNRGLWGLILTLICPPAGLAFLWRKGVFRTRGRMFITVLATIEMTFLFALLMPEQEIITDLPVPVPPVAVTVAPRDDVTSALSNIEQVLAAQQAESGVGVEVEVTMSPEEKAAQAAAEEAILNSKVYSVYSGAKLYHSSTVCGTQSNRRELTVREAMAEGMGACKDCNPPVLQ